ncbi:MAG: type I-E CRISPR-associated protein Cas7/Cse4/CasC [Desulfobaccales bacterium]
MLIQIHLLQSVPPGNLNRDDTGQPKKCIFGGVTRGRISSQCLKRNIRHSMQFKEAFGDELAVRTTYLPRMVADELKEIKPEISEDDLNKIKAALASKFKAEKGKGESDEEGENNENQEQPQSKSAPIDTADQTGQLVFFPPPFAKEIALLISNLMDSKGEVFQVWVDGKKSKKKDRDQYKNDIKNFENEIFKMSSSLTVDIGLFGRMTTSDLVVNVEAACQVAHAISTHEAIVESDYFTAMDDKKPEFAATQTERAGAAFLSSDATYFNSAVYYKYFNLDVDALQKHLAWKDKLVAQAAGVLVRAAACVNPTGKQNSFAAHGVPELILIEVSKAKYPISYANAFLKPVSGSDLMAESAQALRDYVNTVAKAFAPKEMGRVLLAVGSASVNIEGAERVDTLDALVNLVIGLLPKEGSL